MDMRWVVLATLTLMVAVPSDARACGGCFNPVGSPAPVTGHRMAVSLSATQTTLWDQIQYAGAPEDFVWVLPVMGSPRVELADNAFFESLTQTTTIVMTAPTPPRMFCPGTGLSLGCGSFAPTASTDAGAGVTVFHEGVVGPYETATIGSSDPMALVVWLEDNGYAVDDAILPTIAYYVDLGANFSVLRLAPAAGIDRMQPVRITSPGLSLSFPLRMVAAGVQTSVELELFVFAEGRVEAANFGNAEVDRDAITFDWATGAFSYEAEFDNALFADPGPGTNWVTEYASPTSDQLGYYTSYDPDGTVHSATVDVAVALQSIPTPYLTRLRTRLPPSELDRDLLLRATTLVDLGTSISVTRELNRPADVQCGGCAVTPGSRAPLPLVLLLAPIAGMVRRRRRAQPSRRSA